jgi:hypothetical protein
MQSVIVGIVAGLASALLFMAPISGSLLAFPLFILTPLPIAIGGLGWGVTASVVATAAAGIVVGGVLAGVGAAVVFVAVFAAPVAWLAWLATRSVPAAGGDSAPSVSWYPLGRILLHAALAVSAGLVIAGAATGYDPTVIAEEATTVMNEFIAEVETAGTPPDRDSVARFVDLYVAILPFTLAAFMLAATVFNLWLGALIARWSGRPTRPAERLWTVVPPIDILIGFGVTLVLAFLLSGPLGDVAAVLAGSLGCALALVGLAVIHSVTFGMSGRGLILGATYVFTFLSGLPLIVLAALGAADPFLNFRARRSGRIPPP